MDPPASAWFRYYRANNCDSSWEDFLQAIRHRFDPDYYVDYVGVLSNLKQTTSVQDYQAAFEGNLEKISGTAESTLISLFIAGLKQPVQRELNIRRPTTLSAVFALARELEACHQAAAPSVSHQSRRQWQNNYPMSGNKPVIPAAAPVHRATAFPSPHTIPVVRVSPAEKADRQRRGLCYFCEEKWIPGHKCSSTFLAFMGDDDGTACPEIPMLPPPPDLIEATTMEPTVITADVSSIHSLSGTQNPRSLRIVGLIRDTPFQVLLDGGSTHNFIHPSIVEKLCLPLTMVNPFRVYVGNGDSLTYTAFCPKTPIVLQGHNFEIDLYVLAIHGPDIVLGVQWLQTLGEVTHDYANLTVTFYWRDQLVRLTAADARPRPISFNALTALIAEDNDVELFELVQYKDPIPDNNMIAELPMDLPPSIQEVLHAHTQVFRLPEALPPSRP